MNYTCPHPPPALCINNFSHTTVTASLLAVSPLLNPKLCVLRAVSYLTLYTQNIVECLLHSRHSVSSGGINECSVEDLSGTLLEYKYEK